MKVAVLYEVFIQCICSESSDLLVFANTSIYLLTHRQACLPMSILIRPEIESCQDRFSGPAQGRTSCLWLSFP